MSLQNALFERESDAKSSHSRRWQPQRRLTPPVPQTVDTAQHPLLTDQLPPGRVGEPYFVALDTECWDPYWWMTGELPVGMSFDSDGVLKGTPRYAGLYFLTIGFDDVVEGEILTSVSKSFDLLIVEAGDLLPKLEPPEGTDF